MESDASNVTVGNAYEDMHTRFRDEFGVHFSESELQFALAFLDEVFEEGRDIGMKADEVIREEAVAQYQTEFEQKHIAAAVEIARREEREKIVEWAKEYKRSYKGTNPLPTEGEGVIEDIIAHLTTKS